MSWPMILFPSSGWFQSHPLTGNGVQHPSSRQQCQCHSLSPTLACMYFPTTARSVNWECIGGWVRWGEALLAPVGGYCETQPPASIGWVALSSVVRSSSSRIVTSPLISTIWCFRAYKPYIFCEDMILATCQCQHIFCCWVEPSLLLSSWLCDLD